MSPFLDGLKAEVQQMGSTASPSMKAVPKLLECLAVVVVQDALELAEEHPENPVHAMLLENETFRWAATDNLTLLDVSLHATTKCNSVQKLVPQCSYGVLYSPCSGIKHGSVSVTSCTLHHQTTPLHTLCSSACGIHLCPEASVGSHAVVPQQLFQNHKLSCMIITGKYPFMFPHMPLPCTRTLPPNLAILSSLARP